MDEKQKEAIAKYLGHIRPRIRPGIIEYLEKAGTITQPAICEKHGFTVRCLQGHLNKLEDLGVVVDRRISKVKCHVCGQPISAHAIKIYAREVHPVTGKSKGVGGMHIACFEKVRGSAIEGDM